MKTPTFSHLYSNDPKADIPSLSLGVHRFKKRYGLLIRRQRRHDGSMNPAEDITYLVDAIPRFMTITAETSPAAIRDGVMRVCGVEPSLATCARARDEVLHRMENPHHALNQQQPLPHGTPNQQHQPLSGQQPHMPHAHQNGTDIPMAFNTDEDPEVVLQNALRALQQEEADAEAVAAAAREEREQRERAGMQQPLGAIAGQAYAQSVANGTTSVKTPSGSSSISRYPPPPNMNGSPGQPQHSTPTPSGQLVQDLTLTPIPSGAPASGNERPVRCPFCVNQRMLRTIKEAVEHMSTHVVV